MLATGWDLARAIARINIPGFSKQLGLPQGTVAGFQEKYPEKESQADAVSPFMA